MPRLDTANETKDIHEAVEYAREVVIAIANERRVELSSNQIDSYVALVVSNNFEVCAEELWNQIISKLFLPKESTQGSEN